MEFHKIRLRELKEQKDQHENMVNKLIVNPTAQEFRYHRGLVAECNLLIGIYEKLEKMEQVK